MQESVSTQNLGVTNLKHVSKIFGNSFEKLVIWRFLFLLFVANVDVP